MEPILKMTEVNKSFGEGEARVDVLKGISFEIHQSDFVAILGPSGSGKSTLMNIIGLIDTLDSGEYMLEGENINDQSENDYAMIRNQKIGFVFQKFNLISKYTAIYNVALPLLLRGQSIDEALVKAQTMLEQVGLGNRMDYKPSQLSGGQQQRVAIARALVGDASLVLADEPTGALDTKTGQEIMDIFKELNQLGKTILLITHDLNVASRAKRIISIQDGKVFESEKLVH